MLRDPKKSPIEHEKRSAQKKTLEIDGIPLKETRVISIHKHYNVQIQCSISNSTKFLALINVLSGHVLSMGHDKTPEGYSPGEMVLIVESKTPFRLAYVQLPRFE